MVDFLDRLKNNLSLKGLNGLIRQENDQIVEENPPLHIHDLNSLPFIKEISRFIDLAHYNSFNSPLQIQTKRGCPLKCIYCTYNRIEGQRFRLRDPQRIADEIESVVEQTGINTIEFTDSIFNLPLEHSKAVLKALAAKKLTLHISTMGLNPGAIDEEFAELMKKTGFKDVDVGIEAGCDTMLRSLGKNFTKQDILNASKLLHEKKIPIRWSLLIGAPGENEDTLKETFETINQIASKWDIVIIGVGIRVYKGAPIARRLMSEQPDCTRDNFLHPVHYWPGALSLAEIKNIAKQYGSCHANYFMYDEDETVPLILLKIGTALVKTFAPNQPMWRLYILLKSIQKMTGSRLIKMMLKSGKPF
jgi:radical SAM superfamily enzyme YgiQ (UPF0313 family)